jgi:hypothetical protein
MISAGMTSTNTSKVTQTKKFNILPSGTHKLKRKTPYISPIPMVDLTSTDQLGPQQPQNILIQGISKGIKLTLISIGYILIKYKFKKY